MNFISTGTTLLQDAPQVVVELGVVRILVSISERWARP